LRIITKSESQPVEKKIIANKIDKWPKKGMVVARFSNLEVISIAISIPDGNLGYFYFCHKI